MAIQPETGLTYQDLQSFPNDHLRRELIDGELIVTAAPSVRHQTVVMFFAGELWLYTRTHGGRVYPAPTDVFFADDSVVEPDVLYVGPDHLDRLEEKFVRSAPDIVIEVSSPSTRKLELTRKRELYERYGVPEYWYVDLDAERIEVHRLTDGKYGAPLLLLRSDVLESPLLPGLAIEVGAVFGPAAS